MTELEKLCENALYRELQTFDDGRSLVMDMSSNQIYYRKALTVYSIPVFSWIKEHPHPNIPVISAFWQQDDKLIVIEEQINGRTLEQLLEEDSLSFSEKKGILLAVCDALSFLHGARPPIIHRDLKASNIMVTGDGIVKLIDYDAAKLYDKEASRDTVLIGTQGIAAPEQYGFGASDARTDIFALGKLIERLFPDDAAAAVIVEKATRMEPSDRYASVAQVRGKIERLKEGGKRIGKASGVVEKRAETTHGGAGDAGSEGSSKRKWLILAAIAALTVLIILFWSLKSCGGAGDQPGADASQTAQNGAEQSTKGEDPAQESASEDTGESGAAAAESAAQTVPTDEAKSSREQSEFEESTEGTKAPTKDTVFDSSADSTEASTQETTQGDLPWQAAITLEEGEPMGDMRVMKITAALSGGPRDGTTHIRFEIDVKATGEHLSHTTEESFTAGQAAVAMFSVPGTGAGSETRESAAAPEGAYEIRAYSDDGTMMGEFGGKAE